MLLKSARTAEWGGYSGYFAGPDGHPWEVAWNPDFPLAQDGSVVLRLTQACRTVGQASTPSGDAAMEAKPSFLGSRYASAFEDPAAIPVGWGSTW